MKKILDIQSELKAPKGQVNDYGNYKYRSAEDILEAVKPICVKHGCLLTISDKIIAVNERFYVEATARIIDLETKEKVEVTAYAREANETTKRMDASQITGAASSYARKYALNGLFCIDDTKDADTNEYSKQNQQEEKSKKKTTQTKTKKTVEERQEEIKKNGKIDENALDYIVNLCKDTESDPHTICEYYKVSNFAELDYKTWEQACHILEAKKRKKEGK